ncbi:hypothetical protein AB0I82_21775 [Streptomyces sp. NPDC050315]|uniref:hypothetical protein n=1 Tax=Streptomyces sp. NPDC050315 TaxID=3155039 RepID=UPI00342AEF0E
MRLVDDSGLDAYDTGVPADSWRRQPMTPAYCTEPILKDLAPALAAAGRDEASHNRDRQMKRPAALPTVPAPDEAVELNRSLHH